MPIKNSVSEIKRLDDELNIKNEDILSIKDNIKKTEADIQLLKEQLAVSLKTTGK